VLLNFYLQIVFTENTNDNVLQIVYFLLFFFKCDESIIICYIKEADFVFVLMV